MKKSALAIVVALAIISNSANAGIFSKSGASATSASLCIRNTAKAGEIITSPFTGDTETIKNVYGTSTACSVAGTQLADVEFDFTFSSKVRVDLPDEYEVKELSNLEKFNGKVLNAISKSKKNKSIVIDTRKFQANSDPAGVANTFERYAIGLLVDAKSSNAEQLVINGAEAWRFEVTGKLRGLFGVQMTYLYTVFKGDSEIPVVIACSPTSNYEEEKAGFKKIVEGVRGIKSTASSSTSRSVSVASEGEPSATTKAQRAEVEPTGPLLGTGIVVNHEGFVLTNYHVVNECKRVTVRDGNREESEAIVRAKDARNDLAVLLTRQSFRNVASFRSSSTALKLGEPVVGIGFPLAGLLSSEPNASFGNVSATAGLLDDSSQLQISAPVQPGSSGGPLFDQYGNVIGVIRGKLNSIALARVTGDIPQNVNFAIKGEVAQLFMQANDVKFSVMDNPKKSMPSEDIAARGRQIVVLVRCETSVPAAAAAKAPGEPAAAEPSPATSAVRPEAPMAVGEKKKEKPAAAKPSTSAQAVSSGTPASASANEPAANAPASLDELKALLPGK